jgi:hypothetical protein
LTGFPSKVVSFTPGFSPVERHFNSSETVLTVSTAKAGKPLETVFYQCLPSITGLKPGVNETTFKAKPSHPILDYRENKFASRQPATNFCKSKK